MPSPARTRSAALDAVRVLGVAAVVVGHAIPDEGFRAALFGWHVPLFFVLSGYLWKPDLAGIRDEWRSRQRSLVGPYLFWLVVIGVPVLPAPLLWLTAAAGLLAGYLAGSQLASRPLGIGSALPCLVFLLAGHLLRAPIEWLRGQHPAPRLLLGLLLTAVPEALVLAGVVRPFDIKFGDWGTPVAAVAVGVSISAGLVVIADVAYDRMPRPVERATTGLAFASLCVVLVHPVVQWAARPLEPDPVILAAAMLVIPWTMGVALRHTRLSWWATGTPRTERSSAVPAG